MSEKIKTHFVIAGTEKAGTTSIYTYFRGHPQICPSKIKETDFFRQESCDYETYSNLFENNCRNEAPVYMEASPGYLSEAEKVSKQLANTIPDAKILFILRDPVERMLSNYKFHVGRLNIDQNLNFDDYVNKCFLHYENKETPENLGVGKWYLQSLEQGCYCDKLSYFLKKIDSVNLKIMAFDDLKSDIHSFVDKICEFLDVDKQYFKNFHFKKENITFSGNNKWLHSIALNINDQLETLWRRNPRLKQFLLKNYKKLNENKGITYPVSEETITRLNEFYYRKNKGLSNIVESNNSFPWLT